MRARTFLAMVLACGSSLVGTAPAFAEDAAAASGASHAAGIVDPQARAHARSAHTLQPWQGEASVGAFGLGSNDLIGKLGVSYGLPGRVQVSTNILHLGAGLLNLGVKWNFFEHKDWAMAVGFTPSWVNGRWVWVVGGVTGTALASIDVVRLPVELWTSWMPERWMQFDLGLSYVHSFVFGSLDTDFLTADTQLAVRQLRVDPNVRVHVMDRLSLALGARLPVWTRVPGEIEAEVELADGVVAGGSTGGHHQIPFKKIYAVSLEARTLITPRFFTTFGLNYGPMANRLYGSSIYPHFSVDGRF